MTVRVLIGDALSALRTLPAESVQLCVTSPPYFGLRAYGTDPQVWGGDPEHGHEWGDGIEAPNSSARWGKPSDTTGFRNGKAYANDALGHLMQRSAFCPCGSWRGELGSEPTPGLFIEHLLLIFDEVWRVLRKDGLVFCNLGDSYSGGGKGPTGHNGIGNQEARQGFVNVVARGAIGGIPAKNLLLVPHRFAIAMQDRGWIVRSEIAWVKKSSMPESVHGSFYTKHRVTIGEYENLCRLRVDARRERVSSSESSVQGMPYGMESRLPTDGGVPSGQGAISREREGTGNGACSRGAPGRTGEASTVQQFGARPDQQGEVRSDGKGQGGYLEEVAHVPYVGARQGSGSKEGRSSEVQSSVGRSEEEGRPSLSTDRGWQGSSYSGNTATPSGHRRDDGFSADGSGMAGDPEGEPLPLLLLQREDETISGSCDPAEQGWGASQGERGTGLRSVQQSEEQPSDDALVDCPGCAKCAPHGGLILKKGSGRPTSAWEPIWVFAKSGDYFWDDAAVKTETGASMRNVLILGPEPLRDSHYAAFPSAIPRMAILAGTSERGACPACGAGWVRQTTSRIEYTQLTHNHPKYGDAGQFGHMAANRHRDGHIPGRKITDTTGWQPSCSCPPADPVPCVVLDPFLGSGTTAMVADRLGREAIGIELNTEYAEMARRRIEQDAGTLFGETVAVEQPQQIDLFGEVAG